ncbi:MAG: sigma-70 family RNA polymerase sigma factor [Bacteroidota bacterium]
MALAALHNEKELLLRVAGGDDKAFAELFYAYHNQLAGFVLLLTDSVEMTEEVVQDIFVKIWMDRSKLLTVQKFVPYLFILTRNYTLNCIRSRTTMRKNELQYIQTRDTEQSETPEPLNDPGLALLLDRAVAQLPPQQQKVYLMSRREGLKHAEIADQTGLSKETIKKYIQWATESISRFVKAHKEVLSIIMMASYNK